MRIDARVVFDNPEEHQRLKYLQKQYPIKITQLIKLALKRLEESERERKSA